jgi:hypothetical protein
VAKEAEILAPPGAAMTLHIGADMLRKAAEVIEQRQAAYGPPDKNFSNIAAAWNWWIKARYGEIITVNLDATDVAMMSDLIKSARLAETPDHEDSWVDKAGYAACGRQVTFKEVVGERTEPSFYHRTQHDNDCATRWHDKASCNCGFDKFGLSEKEKPVEHHDAFTD